LRQNRGVVMAQLSGEEVLVKTVAGEMEVSRAVRSLVDRGTRRMKTKEGLLVDFKERLDPACPVSLQELARDILAFANTEGGILLIGVSDEGKVVGHSPLDSRQLRQLVGAFTGTRVSYAVGACDVAAEGSSFIIPFLVVQRTTAAGPNLLRRDIETSQTRAQKVKYRAGSLFYREGDQTKVEPPGDGIFDRAIVLNFTYATPRARSSLFLADDRPGLRVYDHINDRFFGRDEEVGELLGKMLSPKGRGASIAGLGGIGKTELAIEVVLRLFKQRRFKKIYSGSAKTLMMTPGGVQHTDPMFQDYPSFVRDLGAWLGLDFPPNTSDEHPEAMAEACLRELRAQERVLFFVDNLETVRDPDLFEFLDNQLPDSVSLITTSRVHKLRNFLFHKELLPLPARESARLLRHELQRQGLDSLADTPISQIEEKAQQLYGNPLAIRWFAWACTRQPTLWAAEPSTLMHKEDVDEFCVAHTLQNLPPTSSKVLSAIGALQDQCVVETDLLLQATRVSAEVLDRALWDLECAGLARCLINDYDGKSSYVIVPLAVPAARDLARKYRWEPDFAKACSEYFRVNPGAPTDDPLLNDLVQRNPRDVRGMSADERQELLRRIARAKGKRPSLEIEVLMSQLEAECHRHSDNIITARDIYTQAAEKLLSSNLSLGAVRYQEVLLEAATVVKQSGTSSVNLNRAARYLEAIKPFTEQHLRVFATLAEIYALLGDDSEYKENQERAREILDAEATQLSFAMRDKAEAALLRAETTIDRRRVDRTRGF